MTEEKMSPLRARMIEDMRIRGMSPKTQQGHIRAVRYLAEFIGRSPDTTTPDELRADQLHMTDSGVSTGVFNARIVSLRFFFGMTCGREEMKRYMQFRRKAKKLPVVLSVEEVGDLLAAVPGPGLKYRAALGISYGAGLSIGGGPSPISCQGSSAIAVSASAMRSPNQAMYAPAWSGSIANLLTRLTLAL